ncbi:MAG: sigma-54-dependent Fis family transcriptional regulator [Deltaproteobacteria bacterium]|nr:sigma-54-dependent Fis family transcriptional regulator [Deltaproteobacteria bacterium]
MKKSTLQNRLLVIDDDSFVRDLFYRTLNAEGYEVFVAADGEEGLIQVELRKPHVIILDLKMPNMDGIRFLEMLKPQAVSPYSIIVVTGLATEEMIRKCYEHNIHAFLRKPVNIHEIKGIVKRTFELIRFSNQIKEEYDQKIRAYELLKLTFNNIVEGCISLNSNYMVEMISEKACGILGVKESAAIGKPISSIVGSFFAGPKSPLFEMISQKKNVRDLKTLFLDNSGKQIPVNASIMEMKGQASRDKWLLIFHDLREEEKRLNQKSGGIFFGSMVSTDPEMKKIFQLIEQVAPSNANIIIEGDSGTGKELAAMEIHQRSTRVHGPFHAVNCAAITPNLLESEFFGHEKGAFTGANLKKVGRFEMANNGTLFLDEVSEILPELQGKLLRAIQEQTFERVGGTKTIKVNVRIIAATNKKLKELVTKGLFREDLYYRLHVIRLILPPLSKRQHDIPLLVSRFIDEFNQNENRTVQGISSGALKCLMLYDWPGNIRELRHAIEYAFAVSKGNILKTVHLQDEIKLNKLKGKQKDLPLINEKTRIIKALQDTNYHRQKAAALLGMHRSTFYRKLNKHGLFNLD